MGTTGIQARKDELLAADELVIRAMQALVTEESGHVWQALRDVRREITVALNNVNYDETHRAGR